MVKHLRNILTHLQKEIKQHLFDYLLLITAGVFFLVALHLFQGERMLEFVILSTFVAFYIMWGVYHHIHQNSMHLKVMVEYILIGFTILFLLKILLIP